jgi:hypothetical protein
VAQVLEILAAERAGAAAELRRRFDPGRALAALRGAAAAAPVR